MRPLPETRSRRLGDNQHQKVAKLKRLMINGLSTTQVTTRSKAKVSKKAKRSLTKKLSPVNNKSPSKNNLNGTGGSSRVNGILQNSTTGSYAGRGAKDGKRTGRLSNGYGKTSRQLVILDNHLNQNGQVRSSSEKSGGKKEEDLLAIQRADAAEKRAERLKKRRSALWVLNCEAESFLFGETAADKHEVELPPISTPPKKRRRIRTNELGTLLKESPILSSKLRSPPLSAEGEQVEMTCCPDRKPSVSASSTGKLSEDYGSSTVDREGEDSPVKNSCVKNELSNIMLQHPIRNSLLLSPFRYSECNSSPDSVRIQNILSSMEWRFSFEDRPSDEAWYSTFVRQENRRSSVVVVPPPPSHSWAPPVLLPYETKIYNNSRSPLKKKKMSRLPRKSPRCHASTLAILSSIKRGRYRNTSLLGSLSTPSGVQANSLLLQAASSSTVTPASAEATSTPERTKRTYKKRKIVEASPTSPTSLDLVAPSPVKTSSLPPVSPPMLTLCSPSASLSSSPASPSSPQRMKDLSATQYLWDSIQFLSDPYVIQVLAEERGISPIPPSTTTTTTTSNHHVTGSYGTKPDTGSVRGTRACSNKKDTNSVLTGGGGGERSRNVSGGSTLNSSNRNHQNNHVKISSSSLHAHMNGTNNNNNNNNNSSSGNTEYILTFDSQRKPSISAASSVRRNLYKSSSASSCSSVDSNDGGANDLKVMNGELSSSNNCGEKILNGHRNNRKSSRKSPVVLVSDIFKSGALKVNTTTTVTIQNHQKAVITSTTEGSSVVVNCDGNHNTMNSSCKNGSREDLLFRVEGLPPLPAWPV